MPSMSISIAEFRAYFPKCLLLALALFAALNPNASRAGVLPRAPRIDYDCSVGGRILVSTNDLMFTGLHSELVNTPVDPEGRNLALLANLTELRRGFCALEAFGEEAGYREDERLRNFFASDEDFRDLVRSLIAVSASEYIGLQRAGIAADLAVQLSSYLPGDEQNAALRKDATIAKLQLGVKGGDSSMAGVLVEAQIADLLPQDKDQEPGFYRTFRAIEERMGAISLDDVARVNHLAVQRALYSLTAQFPEPEVAASGCTGAGQRSGEVRALLVAIGNYTAPEFPDLKGAINDVQLLRKALEIRGVRDIRVATDATRDQLIEEMRSLVSDTGCGDSVLFHYSGSSHLRYGRDATTSGSFLKGWTVWLAPSDADPQDGHAVVPAELSQFISAIRNRGADVLMIVDTNNAAGLDLIDLQELATLRSSVAGRISATESFVSLTPDLGSITAIKKGAGSFAVLYAGDREHLSFEREFEISEGESRFLGVFTYAVARALQTNEDPSVRELLVAVDQEYQAQLAKAELLGSVPYNERPIPVLDASAPDMRFFGRQGAIEQGGLDIEIYHPELARGVRIPESVDFEIVGKLNNSAEFANLTINLRPVKFDAQGRFSARVRLRPGNNELQFGAIDFNYVFHTKTVELEVIDDLERLAVQGEKYALVIGNQNYIEESYNDLETPHSDAAAVAKLLRERFDFKTSIQSPTGSTIDLVLLDARQRQIQSTIRLLRNRLGQESTLLVYYAGHGVYQEDIDRAYWLPVDAVPDQDYTWIKATDITDTLKQIPSRNILVVADSCYSGAMAKRDVSELGSLDESRRKALLKAAMRKSRILIASGATEPVLDGGGGEHSVFARAFIAALAGMDKEIFSSQEIYSQFIYPMVHGNERQEPQHKELEQSGHEGGDVIFWRATTDQQ
jgi:hypothetical protein